MTRALSLRPYVDTLHNIGAPVEAGLQRARLPVNYEEFPLSWVSYEFLAAFVADMADRQGISNLGLTMPAFDTHKSLVSSIERRLHSSPTVLEALGYVINHGNLQTTNVKLWLAQAGDRAALCFHLGLPYRHPGVVHCEVRSADLVIAVVRACLGPSFRPLKVLLATSLPDLDVRAAEDRWGAPVLVDQPHVAIEFSRSHFFRQPVSSQEHETDVDTDDPLADSLTDLLASSLLPYLVEGYPPLELAAEISGLSARTLQRRLAEEQTSYGRLIERIRYRAAVEDLRKPDCCVSKIAERLGYSETSAFTRAFTRWSGYSPTQYRTLLQSGITAH